MDLLFIVDALRIKGFCLLNVFGIVSIRECDVVVIVVFNEAIEIPNDFLFDGAAAIEIVVSERNFVFSSLFLIFHVKVLFTSLSYLGFD